MRLEAPKRGGLGITSTPGGLMHPSGSTPGCLSRTRARIPGHPQVGSRSGRLHSIRAEGIHSVRAEEEVLDLNNGRFGTWSGNYSRDAQQAISVRGCPGLLRRWAPERADLIPYQHTGHGVAAWVGVRSKHCERERLPPGKPRGDHSDAGSVAAVGGMRKRSLATGRPSRPFLVFSGLHTYVARGRFAHHDGLRGVAVARVVLRREVESPTLRCS